MHALSYDDDGSVSASAMTTMNPLHGENDDSHHVDMMGELALLKAASGTLI